MNKQFSIGKVIVHGVDGTSVYRDIDEALTHLGGNVVKTKGSEKPRSILDTDSSGLGSRILAAHPGLGKQLRSTREDPYAYGDAGVVQYVDPIEPLTRLSGDMKLYDDVGTREEFCKQDLSPTGHASISVDMSGDKWFTNDLLRVLEATILDTIREYKEFNPGARSLQTQVSTSTSSTQ